MGVPVWLSQFSVLLLVLGQVMISRVLEIEFMTSSGLKGVCLKSLSLFPFPHSCTGVFALSGINK